MRNTLFFSAIVGLAAAVPSPQNFAFDAIDAATTVTVVGPAVTAVTQTLTYNTVAAASSAAAAIATAPATPNRRDFEERDIVDDIIESRDLIDLESRQIDVNAPCAPQPDGYGPVTNHPDTAAAFLANHVYSAVATVAAWFPPSGYSVSFSNMQASVNAQTYLGLTTLESYNTTECQELCDGTPLCTAFNIYYERDPTLNPAAACPNPASFTNIKCTLWGSGVTAAAAVNTGQTRVNFTVVIAGSNGYQKDVAPTTQPGFTIPTKCGGAINAPLNSAGSNTYIGAKYFPGPYDASLCSAVCTATTADNKLHATNGVYVPCNFFNSYILSIGNVPTGTYCSLYSQPWDKSYGTNTGASHGSLYYGVSSSYGFSLSVQDPGVVSS